eukprot:CAMPEP_0195134124 /NCGR_PEP_ID=MMETSP0448-20130528/150053_1 /TAXON_ID=66468 /ORGANISM="Heterocapsa triquestra, Strain CCMP 448" /LENGTH=135 /DNA_ID=CAMNT_0040172211 /DNA_START=15 /DNA_END=423 /DNA_ORIENTATION=-
MMMLSGDASINVPLFLMQTAGTSNTTHGCKVSSNDLRGLVYQSTCGSGGAPVTCTSTSDSDASTSSPASAVVVEAAVADERPDQKPEAPSEDGSTAQPHLTSSPRQGLTSLQSDQGAPCLAATDKASGIPESPLV